MRSRTQISITLLTILALAAPALAAKKLEGRWALSVTIPVAPDSKTNQTLVLTLDVSPRGESLHGRMTITDDAGRTIGGVYRQNGKKVSITYELPCASGAPCASLVLKGKIKNEGTTIKGSVVVLWDSANAQNPALFDSSNGKFSGQRLE
jgi:hypothetical protein